MKFLFLVSFSLHLSNFFSAITAKKDTRPQLVDLYSEVVPKYATNWDDLGIKLGLEKHHIDTISQNNAYNPNRLPECCKAMLNKWLEIDCSATWDKIRNAISTISKQGNYVSTLHAYLLLKKLYIIK